MGCIVEMGRPFAGSMNLAVCLKKGEEGIGSGVGGGGSKDEWR